MKVARQTSQEFISWLRENDACDSGIKHARAKGYVSIQDAVSRCPIPGYVAWLLAVCADRPTKIRIATECARLALPHAGQEACLLAIEAAEACIDIDNDTQENRQAAYDAANSARGAAYAAHTADAADSVDVAAYAADTAADAANAADATAYAAAHAHAAGKDAVLSMLRSRFRVNENGVTVYTSPNPEL